MIINEKKILSELKAPLDVSRVHVEEVLLKARELKGIDYNDVLTLLKVEDSELLAEVYKTANWLKNEIYGNRLVLFAPLYISNLCNNECLYCAFRAKNKELARKVLTQDEIVEETKALLEQGHKRVLLVAGESYPKEGLDFVFKAIDSVYSARVGTNNIRRINVNIAPLNVEEFKLLKSKNIGTYQLFQETYHLDTYNNLHVGGPKSDYNFRLETVDRAFEAGFDDLGIGILFGLYDWRYEILALLSHIKHLENKFGVGPHTISVPRIEPALNSEVSYNPPYVVNDEDFKKIIAVLRIAVPYTGIILSTRETSATRKFAFDLGISQISAGSRTNPGGYNEEDVSNGMEEQFSLGDTRPLLEVIKDVVDSKYIPSFCTGCYRLGRVGKDFMDLAKPGLIKEHCLPNAMFTFAEYLHDFADVELKKSGFELIENMIQNDISNIKLRQNVIEKLHEIELGKRDIYL
ncbi:MAG: [FeFe] hydrogenase H-cluster radical SAM maturase HydG [Planctomycetes bacterium]|nr:[FeFe] hydrogenase H-cluster radical SAM maturase HydG [Planctomycetota bacterium]